MGTDKSDFAGYLRDLVAAVLGCALLFGLKLDNQQIGGILLVVTTAVAFGTYLYKARKGEAT